MGCGLARSEIGSRQLSSPAAIGFLCNLSRKELSLFALREWHILVHLRQSSARLRQARAVCERHQRIGADPVLLGIVGVKVRKTEHILRARITAILLIAFAALIFGITIAKMAAAAAA